MRTLAMSGHRCKESLDAASASLLLMHALRQLRDGDAHPSGHSQNPPQAQNTPNAQINEGIKQLMSEPSSPVHTTVNANAGAGAGAQASLQAGSEQNSNNNNNNISCGSARSAGGGSGGGVATGGVATGVHAVPLVGGMLIAGALIVKGRTASETFDNYRELSSALYAVILVNKF